MTVANGKLDYANALRLDGRGFVVLGAGGGGMGTQTSLALAAAGAELLCVDFRDDEANDAAAATGGMAHVADVTSRKDMEGVFARAHDVFGPRFHGVIDIVGVASMGPIASFDDDAIERQFAIIYRHALLTTQMAGPMLARRGGGTVVFVGSVSGLRSVDNQAIYGTAKAAQHHLMQQAALEFGPMNVRFNVIAPGFVKTPRLAAAIPEETWSDIASRIPMRRVADPADIAGAALFLASDMSRYVTGNILVLDGGSSGHSPTPVINVKR